MLHEFKKAGAAGFRGHFYSIVTVFSLSVMLDEETCGLLLRLCCVGPSMVRYLSKRALGRLAEMDSLFLDFLDMEDELRVDAGA